MADKGSVAKGLLERLLISKLAQLAMRPTGAVVVEGVGQTFSTVTTVGTVTDVTRLNGYGSPLNQIHLSNGWQAGLRSRIVKS
jgi:hypothetical protein